MHISDFPDEAFHAAWKNSMDDNVVVSDLQPSGEKMICNLDPWHRSSLPTFMRPNLSDNGLDILSLHKARAKLVSLSLINFDTFKVMTRLHPVTHAWSKDRLKDPGSATAWLNALAMLSLSVLTPEKYQPLEQLLQPHFESMAKLQATTIITKTSPAFNTLFIELGAFCTFCAVIQRLMKYLN